MAPDGLNKADRERLAHSIVRVGGGMGVVVGGQYILTAAHVVSRAGLFPDFFSLNAVTVPVSAWPAAHGDAQAVLVCYEPVADFAVLGVDQCLPERAGDALLDLLDDCGPASVAFDVPDEPFSVHVLNCEGSWVDLQARPPRGVGPDLFLRGSAAPQVSFGTSGGPIRDDAGRVVGLVRRGELNTDKPEPEACLVARALPVWLAEQLQASQRQLERAKRKTGKKGA